MKANYYVGIVTKDRLGARIVFKSETTPTRTTHGEEFAAVIGPFRTKRAALFTQAFGQGNPHIQHVNDAERLSKLYLKEGN